LSCEGISRIALARQELLGRRRASVGATMEGPFRKGAALLIREGMAGATRRLAPSGSTRGRSAQMPLGRTGTRYALWRPQARLSLGRSRPSSLPDPKSGCHFASVPPSALAVCCGRFRQASLPRPESLCRRRQSARLPKGAGPRSGRVRCLGFAVRIPISRACHRGSTGTAARKGHQNGFPQATVAPHESPPTHL
jgi:hypothetical protein